MFKNLFGGIEWPPCLLGSTIDDVNPSSFEDNLAILQIDKTDLIQDGAIPSLTLERLDLLQIGLLAVFGLLQRWCNEACAWPGALEGGLGAVLLDVFKLPILLMKAFHDSFELSTELGAVPPLLHQIIGDAHCDRFVVNLPRALLENKKSQAFFVWRWKFWLYIGLSGDRYMDGKIDTKKDS